MFCETKEELALLERALEIFPDAEPYFLGLACWAYINHKDEYLEIMKRNKENKFDLLELENENNK